MTNQGRISVDYVHMEDAVRAMKEISQVVDQKLDVLRREVGELSEHWQGEAKLAWRTHQDNWDAAVVELNDLLNDIAMRVGKARQNYIDTEDQVTRTWRNATVD